MSLFPARAVIKRELLAELRRPRSFVFLALMVAGAGTVAVHEWPQGVLGFGQMAAYSSQLCAGIVISMLVGGLLLLPGLAALSVVAEREMDTYDQLRLTLIRPISIVWGKFAALFGLFVLLALGMLPLIGIVFFAVGVDPGFMAVRVAFVAALVGWGTALGLLAGAIFRPAVLAVPAAYIALGACLALGDQFAPGPAFAAPLFATLLSFFASAKLLSRATRGVRITAAKPIDDPSLLEARRKKFPYYLIDPLRRTDLLPDEKNPLLLREIRWGLFTRATRAIRIAYGTGLIVSIAGIVFLGVMTNVWNVKENVLWFVGIQLLFLLLMTGALSSAAFSRERQSGNLDMLRMTLLTPRQMIDAKLAGCFMSLTSLFLGLMFAWLPTLALLIALERGGPVLLGGLPTMLACLWLCVNAGIFASVITPRTSLAFLLTVVVMVAILAAPIAGYIYQTQSAAAYQGPVRVESMFPLPYLSPLLSYGMFFGVMRKGAVTYAGSSGAWPFSNLLFVFAGATLRWLSVWQLQRRFSGKLKSS